MNRYKSNFINADLILKYLRNELKDSEKEILQKWLNESSANQVLFDQLTDEMQISIALNRYTDSDKAEVRKKILEQIDDRSIITRLWPRIAAVSRSKFGTSLAAAAAVAMVVFGVWFFNYRSTVILNSGQNPALAMHDVAPGKNGATLTLANGKVIQLSDAKTGVVIGEDLKYSDGEILRDALDDKGAEDIAAETQKGQTYIFTLPDGTKVWLNAASTLIIPSSFSGTEARKISLEGEAYFEVAKDKKRPFIVESKGQEVTVLGTHFNISAYADEGAIKTTLLEGSVKVAAFGKTTPPGGHPSLPRSGLGDRTSPPDPGGVPEGGGGRIGKTTPATPPLLDKEGTILKPGQQSVITGSNRIKVEEVNANKLVAWKSGKFVFENEEIESIMRKLARWYNVEVVYEDGVKQRAFTGSISKYDNISRILDKISYTQDVHFKIEGRRVTVMK